MCMSIHLVTQVPHHNPSTWDMNGGICISPSYPYPRARSFPKPRIQMLEKIYPNHHITHSSFTYIQATFGLHVHNYALNLDPELVFVCYILVHDDKLTSISLQVSS